MTSSPNRGCFPRQWLLLCARKSAPKKFKNNFFPRKVVFFNGSCRIYNYFTVLIYLATWKAAKLHIFIHFTFTNLAQCSQSINWLIYVYSIQIPSCFLWALYQSRDRTSSHYRHPKKFLYYPLKENAWA